MKKTLILLLLIIIFSAQSYASSARVKNVKGVIFIIRSYDTLKKNEFLAEDGIVVEGDLITTGKNASCDIYWADKVYTRLGENTQIKIDEFSTGDKKIFTHPEIHLDIKLINGEIRNKLRKINMKRETFKVSSPALVVAVRGTDFTTNHSNNLTSVNVSRGSVNVFNLSTGRIQTVSQGGSISVSADVSKTGQSSTSEVVPTIEFDARGLIQSSPPATGALDKTINSQNILNLQNFESNITPRETILNLQGTF